MPEEQTVLGDSWHRRFNRFLETVLKWQQLADSSTDVPDPLDEKRRARGLDSVFSYKRNASAPQQIVLVEAKSVHRMKDVSRLKIQGWLDALREKVEHLPSAQEFRDKFQPETGAQYQSGLIGLWVRDVDTYSHSQLRMWLSQVRVSKRKIPSYIGLLSNQAITTWCAIHQEVEHLRSTECEEIQYHFPDYGDKPLADGTAVPMEAAFSRLVFCRARMRQETRSRVPSPCQAYVVFYLGQIRGYADLRFLGLALKHFQMLRADQLIIYTLQDCVDIRNEIAIFRQRLGADGAPQDADDRRAEDRVRFRQLAPSNQLPSWMVRHD